MWEVEKKEPVDITKKFFDVFSKLPINKNEGWKVPENEGIVSDEDFINCFNEFIEQDKTDIKFKFCDFSKVTIEELMEKDKQWVFIMKNGEFKVGFIEFIYVRSGSFGFDYGETILFSDIKGYLKKE